MRAKSIVAVSAAALALSVFSATPGITAEPALNSQETLGKHLFFDKDLSANKNQSCATCHAPESGWTGPDNIFNAHGAVYEGSIAGRFGDRKPPSAAYATQSPLLVKDSYGVFSGGNFWDGRATGEVLGSPTAEQAQGPYLNPVEQALPDSACVVYRACTSDYAKAVTTEVGKAVCNTPWPKNADALCGADTSGLLDKLPKGQQRKVKAAYDKFAYAIAAYEGSDEVNAFSSKYDAYKAGRVTLNAQEKLGESVFEGKGQCSACHVTDGDKPLMTDYTYDNLGMPKNPENPVYKTNPDFVDLGLGGYLQTRPDYAADAEAQMGTFKVPTVRNVAKGEPEIVKALGHNGYFKTLYGIVHFYNTRDVLPTCAGDYTEAEALAANCWPKPELEANMNTEELGNLGLTYEEELALVAFMETMSDGYEG